MPGAYLLAKHEVGVVICDQRMPSMDGIELLSRIRSLYPCVTRIMLSAYSESETVIVAVNRGAIYNYSVKPCNPSDRSEGVRAGIRVYREQRSRSALPA